MQLNLFSMAVAISRNAALYEHATTIHLSCILSFTQVYIAELIVSIDRIFNVPKNDVKTVKAW